MESSRWAVGQPDARPIHTISEPETAPSFTEQTAEMVPQSTVNEETKTAQYSSTTAPLADDLFADDYEPIEESVPEPPSSRYAAPALAPAQPPRQPRPRKGSSEKFEGVKQKPPPKGPAAPDGPKTEAVRGDRSGTGGVKKEKLTEEELTARMEAMKLKNAALLAARERAEADEASFQAREAQAEERRRRERQQKQQLEGERERNRMRKLKAQAGREWDAEKEAQLAAEPRRYEAGPDPTTDGGEIKGSRPARGRGGRRGYGRGARNSIERNPEISGPVKEQAIPTAEDFPALVSQTSVTPAEEEKPTVEKPPEPEQRPALSKLNASSEVFIPSWADEMDNSTPVEAKASK